MIRILLVRHGETEWNKDHRLQGHSDISLAESGVQQARITGGFVRAPEPPAGLRLQPGAHPADLRRIRPGPCTAGGPGPG